MSSGNRCSDVRYNYSSGEEKLQSEHRGAGEARSELYDIARKARLLSTMYIECQRARFEILRNPGPSPRINPSQGVATEVVFRIPVMVIWIFGNSNPIRIFI